MIIYISPSPEYLQQPWFFLIPRHPRHLCNMNESYHLQLRKVAKRKSIFPNDESLPKMLYLAIWMCLENRQVRYWGQILIQLSIFFPDKVKSTLASFNSFKSYNC